jgi:hypothetical protein
MMKTAKLSLSHRNMICAAIQVLRSRDTLTLINQNKESIHDPIQSGHSWKLKQCTVQNSLKAAVHEASRQARQEWKFSVHRLILISVAALDSFRLIQCI